MKRGFWIGLIVATLLVVGVETPVSGQGGAAQIQAAIRALLAGNNTWTGSNTFGAITVNSCTGCGGGSGTITTSAPLSGNGAVMTPVTLAADADVTLADLTLTDTLAGPAALGDVQITAVVPHGTTGSTCYGYRVAAVLPDGVRKTAVGNHYDTCSGNATLSGMNFNRITWDALPGAASYLLFRYDGDSGYPIGIIATTTTGLTADDIGQSPTLPQPILGTSSYPLVTDGLYISGPGNVASIVLDAAGTLGQIRNTGYGGLEFAVPSQDSIFPTVPLAIYPYNYWGTNGLSLVEIGYGANLNIGNEVGPNLTLSGGIMWGEGVAASQNEANQVQMWQVDDGANNASLWILGETGAAIVIGGGTVRAAYRSSNGTVGITGDASLADTLHFVDGIYVGKN